MAYHSTPLDVSASTDVITPPEGRRVRVVGFVIVVAGDVAVKFQSKPAGSGTDITGNMALKAGVAAVGEGNYEGRTFLFETKNDEKLRIVLGGAVQVGGWVNWVDVKD